MGLGRVPFLVSFLVFLVLRMVGQRHAETKVQAFKAVLNLITPVAGENLGELIPRNRHQVVDSSNPLPVQMIDDRLAQSQHIDVATQQFGLVVGHILGC